MLEACLGTILLPILGVDDAKGIKKLILEEFEVKLVNGLETNASKWVRSNTCTLKHSSKYKNKL